MQRENKQFEESIFVRFLRCGFEQSMRKKLVMSHGYRVQESQKNFMNGTASLYLTRRNNSFHCISKRGAVSIYYSRLSRER